MNSHTSVSSPISNTQEAAAPPLHKHTTSLVSSADLKKRIVHGAVSPPLHNSYVCRGSTEASIVRMIVAPHHQLHPPAKPSSFRTFLLGGRCCHLEGSNTDIVRTGTSAGQQSAPCKQLQQLQAPWLFHTGDERSEERYDGAAVAITPIFPRLTDQ